MAKLRKFIAYRRLERPYTRVSKFRNKSYVRTRPHLKIARFEMGELTKPFPYKVHLVSEDDFQVRDNALDSGRQAGNRQLETKLGKGMYRLTVRAYPHHMLRENALAAGAGADRMSTGMAHSFGKVVGIAARIRVGQEIFTAHVHKEGLEIAKEAMRKINSKLPGSCRIVIEESASKKK